MSIRSILLAALALGLAPVNFCAAIEQRLDDTVVVDASDFIDRFPTGDTLVSARNPDLLWLFDNMAINLGATTDLVTQVSIPKEGEYSLYVRAKGQAGSGFKVSINGQLSDHKFGDGELSLVKGGTFYLRKDIVEIRITGISPGALLDVLALSSKPELTEDDLAETEYPGEVALLKDYQIPPASSVKFGDLTGERDMDFVVMTPNWSAYAYGNNGVELWHWSAPTEGADLRRPYECPGAVWDFDQDGRAEVIQWRMIDGKEWLCMCEGATGEIRYKVEWPAPAQPHAYNCFRTAIARLHEGYADSLVVFADSGQTQTIAAYGPRLNQLWSVTEKRPSDSFGRGIRVMDVDGDNVDEILVGAMCIDASGKTRWDSAKDSSQTPDPVHAARFADLNGDGGLEMVAAQGNAGVAAYDIFNGHERWKSPAGSARTLEIGSFLMNAPAPQVIVGSAQEAAPASGAPATLVRWFSPTGKPLDVWPANPLNLNGYFVKGDWYGNERPQLFWSRFHMEPSGKGTLFFSEDVYQMFDFMGNGNEQVITLDPRGILRVYGYSDARLHDPHRSAEYMRTSVANRGE